MLNHFIYIDPGSGSLLFQALLSSLLTGLVFIKRITMFIKSLFTRKTFLKEKELL